jgi:hypothetical protein
MYTLVVNFIAVPFVDNSSDNFCWYIFERRNLSFEIGIKMKIKDKIKIKSGWIKNES